ncbi:MAG: MoxR family ATPase [Lachnospiraceae bacterium]|nr:MoxR family ATPase [Lachnospiraceae bacterium]
MNPKIMAINEEINQIVRGKDELIKKVLAAIFCGGNILLEDIPGVGKTTLALAISRVMNLDYKRIQFTPDVLPSDITGFSMYNNKTNEFEYKEGAAMTNLLLADEINRTSPKTQSALLEIMEEKRVTVDGITHSLPDPFIVIATENPIGSSGTQMLPESQLDRFMICMSLGYPCHSDAIDILKNNTSALLAATEPILHKEDLIAIQKEVEKVFVHDSIYEYIVTLTEITRTDERFSLGGSPRSSLALLNLSKGMAVMNGRDFVTPKDVVFVYPDVMGHRVKLSSQGKALGKSAKEILSSIPSSLPMPMTADKPR